MIKLIAIAATAVVATAAAVVAYRNRKNQDTITVVAANEEIEVKAPNPLKAPAAIIMLALIVVSAILTPELFVNLSKGMFRSAIVVSIISSLLSAAMYGFMNADSVTVLGSSLAELLSIGFAVLSGNESFIWCACVTAIIATAYRAYCANTKFDFTTFIFGYIREPA